MRGVPQNPPPFMPHSPCVLGPGVSAPSLHCRAADALAYFLRLQLERLQKQVQRDLSGTSSIHARKRRRLLANKDNNLSSGRARKKWGVYKRLTLIDARGPCNKHILSQTQSAIMLSWGNHTRDNILLQKSTQEQQLKLCLEDSSLRSALIEFIIYVNVMLSLHPPLGACFGVRNSVCESHPCPWHL